MPEDQRRIDLQIKLESVLGFRNVYFQAPKSADMKYPCIVYKRHTLDAEYADNKKYLTGQSYLVTVIYKNPDDPTSKKLFESFDFCSSNTPTYVNDGLYHDVFTIYW